MERTFSDIDDLIGKYLAGEASADEQAFVESWMRSDEANRKYFTQFKVIFDKAGVVKDIPQFDTDAAWNKVKSKLGGKQIRLSVKVDDGGQAGNYFWRIAASIVIVLGVGFFAYRMLNTETTALQVATDTKPVADTLPDGSGVFLNKATTVAYTFNKKEKTHRVKLQGEAYFDIHHDDKKTFIVEAGEVLIKDIGTSFNVKAYPNSDTIEVVVEEGEVMFYAESNPGINLKAGGKGIYNRKTKTFAVAEAEPNVTAYKTRFFIFSDNDLGTVVNKLNEVYDQKIIISDSLKNCRITVTFNNENAEEIAQVIAETLGFTVKGSDRGILLEGKACEK